VAKTTQDADATRIRDSGGLNSAASTWSFKTRLAGLLSKASLFQACIVTVLLGTAAPVQADLTAFAGTQGNPSSQVRGFGLGLSLLMFGLEFEYSDTTPRTRNGLAGTQTGMFNLLAQSPFVISHLQFYATIGGGFYKNKEATWQETGRATNAGGGVKISLTGPIRLRIDYRVFMLPGGRQGTQQQRFYTGLNLAF